MKKHKLMSGIILTVMALAIIGGLISSTILTLLVVPAIYRIMYPIDAWLRKWYEKGTV